MRHCQQITQRIYWKQRHECCLPSIPPLSLIPICCTFGFQVSEAFSCMAPKAPVAGKAWYSPSSMKTWKRRWPETQQVMEIHPQKKNWLNPQPNPCTSHGFKRKIDWIIQWKHNIQTQEDLVISNFYPSFFPVEGQHGQLKVERVDSAAGRASCGARGATGTDGWMSAKVLPKASDPRIHRNKKHGGFKPVKNGMIYSISHLFALEFIYFVQVLRFNQYSKSSSER